MSAECLLKYKKNIPVSVPYYISILYENPDISYKEWTQYWNKYFDQHEIPPEAY